MVNDELSYISQKCSDSYAADICAYEMQLEEDRCKSGLLPIMRIPTNGIDCGKL